MSKQDEHWHWTSGDYYTVVDDDGLTDNYTAFEMGTKDAANALVDYLNDLEQRLRAAEALAALATTLRGSIGLAYISERAVYEFIRGYDALNSEPAGEERPDVLEVDVEVTQTRTETGELTSEYAITQVYDQRSFALIDGQQPMFPDSSS